MSRAQWFVAGVLMLVVAGFVAASPIEDIMVQCHKPKTGLRDQIKVASEAASPNWADIQKKSKEFVDQASMLEKNDPPRGYKDSWKKLTAAFVEQVKALDAAAGKQDAKTIADVNKKLGAHCKACHDAHQALCPPPPTGDKIVAPDAKLELLFTRTAPIMGGLTEGPAVAPDGSIYFSDIPFGSDKGMILRFDPKTKKTTVFSADSGKSNGLRFDAQGNLIACEGSDEGGRRLARYDVKTGKSVTIADKFMGKRFNAPNDMAIDRKGRIYFSDPRYLGTEPRELEYRAVYRIDRDGSVVEVTHDVEKPNGIALSPDEKTLYLADHNNGTDRIDPAAPSPKKGAMKVYAFPLNAEGLVSGPRKTLVDFEEENGCDGMCVDEHGRIYLAARGLKRPGVLVIDPTGKEVAFIPTGPSQPGADKPVGIPSNVTFGIGPEAKTLYVTVDTSLYRIPLKVAGLKKPFER